MAILTIRAKNQVTIPADVLAKSGLKQGDPIEFEPLKTVGIAIRKYGSSERRENALEWARRLAAANPGVEDVEFELETRASLPAPTEL